MQLFNKTILSNGLRIITAPMPTSLATTLLVLVEAGSKYETKNINGLSHFLEHMCFKGTEKRPSAFHIASELDALGSEYNAFTGKEFTGYYAKVRNEHLDKILEIVSDMYLNPVFKAEEIEKERGVIIEEINMYEDLPMRRVQELFTSLLYGDQPAGWDIAGRKEIIRKLQQEDFIDYRGKHYLAKSTVVAAAGNFDEKSLISKIEQAFAGISDGTKGAKEKTHEEQSKPEILLQTKKSDQTHIVLGVRAYDLFNPLRYPLQVLSDILGGGMSSRLFQSIREKLGAAYYVKAEPDLYTDHGFLTVSAGIDHNRMEEVIKAALEEFQKLKEEEIPEEELGRAKEHLAGGFVLGLESSDELANFYGGEEITRREILTPEQIIREIQKVDSVQIKKVARDIFQNSKLNLAVIGPFEDKEKLQRILTIK